jgi:hypothetical protein
MKKKAVGLIILYLSMIIIFPVGNYIQTRTIVENAQVDENFQIVQEISSPKKEFQNKLNVVMDSKGTVPNEQQFEIQDFTSPSYTNLTASENNPIIEGTSVTLTSSTTSSGYGVSSGMIDFADLTLQKIDNDPTSTAIYSNKYALGIALQQDTTISGFVTDITPTIREDINFYIRTSLTGTDLRTGTILGSVAHSAHITNQLLYVPFSRCGGLSPLTLIAGTTYYFILEPSTSSSDTFFELQESLDIPNNIDIYEWYNSNFAIYHTDVNFYLITDEITIENDIPVNALGVATTNWQATPQGNHSLFSWYHGAVVYSESYGTCERAVVPTTDILQVAVDPIVTQYKDNTTIRAVIIDEFMLPASDKTVTFSTSSDGLTWSVIGSAVSNSLGEAELVHEFDLIPGNYFLKAYVNDFSYDTNSLDILEENLVFEFIDFSGRYRNNPGMPTFTKLSTEVLVKDDDGNPISDFDIELWYKIDEVYQWIPHFYTTNASGYVEILHSVEDLSIGNHLDTHYFAPASYEVGYQGNSNYGDCIVDKGLLDLESQSYITMWNDDLQLSTQVKSLGEGWAGIVVEYSYYDNQWHTLGTCVTNSSGYANLMWAQIPLTAGNYLIRVHAYESQYFEEDIVEDSLIVNRQTLNMYFIKSGELKGNGEEIDLEYTSTMHLVFFVTFSDGTPAANIALKISSRPIQVGLFYTVMGYTTTNGSGYALFNNYENLTLVGNQYLCKAEIDQTNKYEEASLSIKINLLPCTPIVYLEDHLCEKGTSTEIVIYVINKENRPLYLVQVQIEIAGQLYYGVSDPYGYIRIYIAPDLPVGRHDIDGFVITDYRYTQVNCSADLVISKGMPQFTLFDSYAKVDGFLTITAQALDMMGRPIAGLSVQISFFGWNEYFTTDANGFIEYTFQLADFGIGSYMSVLTFNGNSDWFDTMATGTVLIYENDSDLELLTTSISCTYGEEIYLEALLNDHNNLPLENRIVIFVLENIDGTSIILGQNTTTSLGYASLRVTIYVEPGSYDLFAKYLGAVDYGPSYGLTSFVIQKAQILMLGSDFNAIINSTTTFSVTVTDIYGAPILYEQFNIYIWINNSWLFLGSFQTNAVGIVEIILEVMYDYGVYIIKIEFTGNEYYTSNYLNIDMTVIEPPPKIMPNISIETSATTYVDFEEIQFNLYVANAFVGSTIIIHVFIDGVFNGSLFVVSGVGHYLWSTAKIGTYMISFVSVADSVYYESSEQIIIEIIQNAPPELVGYSYSDYISEGEPLNVEATFYDASGVDKVWLVINGTYYEMAFNGMVYSVIIYDLQQGIYNATLCAIDKQGQLSYYELTPLNVFARKTQMIKYHLNSNVLEYGQELYFEVLVFGVNTIGNVYFILNSTEYLMYLGYEVSDNFSVWYIYLESLPIGNYGIEVKIVETTSFTVIGKISDIVQVIPVAPELSFYKWSVSKSGESDIVSGNLTFNSFYLIYQVELWLDDQRITATKVTDNVYSFNAYVTHSKNHILRIKVSDVMGRIYNNEFLIGKIGLSTLITAIIAVSIIIVLVGIGLVVVFAYRQRKIAIEDPTTTELEIIEIDDVEADISSTELGRELLEDNNTNKSRRRNQQSPISAIVSADLFDIDEDQINEDLESVEIKPEPNFVHVKEYIAKVREDGLIPDNGSNGNDARKTIDDLATLNIEIDYRLLPVDEQVKKLAEKEKDDKPHVMSLKEIADEIEETFKKKK